MCYNAHRTGKEKSNGIRTENESGRIKAEDTEEKKMSEITLTKDNWEAEVMQSDVPVLVDFWASWCGPCKMLAPVVAQIAQEQAGKVKVGKVNVDMEQELAAQFRVMSIPTLILFKNGEVAAQTVGVQPKAQIEALFA